MSYASHAHRYQYQNNIFRLHSNFKFFFDFLKNRFHCIIFYAWGKFTNKPKLECSSFAENESEKIELKISFLRSLFSRLIVYTSSTAFGAQIFPSISVQFRRCNFAPNVMQSHFCTFLHNCTLYLANWIFFICCQGGNHKPWRLLQWHSQFQNLSKVT